jgi:hypothetical protein
MTDRELLDLAAKAAGKKLVGPVVFGGRRIAGTDHFWGPYTNEGEAFRLAIKCDLLTEKSVADALASRNADAFCRAAVCAAAEIGRLM